MLGRDEEANRMLRDVYAGRLKLNGDEHEYTFIAADNYALSLLGLQRFEEAKALLRKMMPVARRVLGESYETTLKMRTVYARALFLDAGATQGRGVVRSTAQYSRPRTLRSTCVVLRRYCGYKYINFYYLRWWGARAARSERWFARCRGAVESEGTRVVASILVATAALRTRRSDFFLVHFFCRLAAGTSLRRHGRFVVVEFQVFVRVSKQVLLFLHVVVNI